MTSTHEHNRIPISGGEGGGNYLQTKNGFQLRVKYERPQFLNMGQQCQDVITGTHELRKLSGNRVTCVVSCGCDVEFV
jgi:hypothetical protein